MEPITRITVPAVLAAGLLAAAGWACWQSSRSPISSCGYVRAFAE